MKQIFTIAALTWKSAFRYRLFWVLTALLISAVVGLPILIKDDGSAQGLTQILLTYTLSSITALLGFATLWLSCGSLARDIEECQMQVVATKPVARWQIWLGKWLGILGLNAALLAISGTSVFVLLEMRANQLPPEEKAILQREIFVARASIKEAPEDVSAEVEADLKEVMRANSIDPQKMGEMRERIRATVIAQKEVVQSGYERRWVIELGPMLRDRLKDVPLQLRIKFRSANPNTGATYLGDWHIGPPDSPQVRQIVQENLPPDSFQEFQIPPNLASEDGKLTIEFWNRNRSALLFGLDNGLEVLYPEGTFGLNFARGLGVILCWLALLSTIGLAAASWLSFPVAAFFSLSLLLMGLSSDTLSSAVEQKTVLGLDHETGKPMQPAFDSVLLPIFTGALTIIKTVEDFSPVDSLSTGRSITWGQLGMAFTQIVLVMGGFFSIVGILLFNRRELAAVQSSS